MSRLDVVVRGPEKEHASTDLEAVTVEAEIVEEPEQILLCPGISVRGTPDGQGR